jgi:hypothetical protein
VAANKQAGRQERKGKTRGEGKIEERRRKKSEVK